MTNSPLGPPAGRKRPPPGMVAAAKQDYHMGCDKLDEFLAFLRRGQLADGQPLPVTHPPAAVQRGGPPVQSDLRLTDAGGVRQGAPRTG